MAGLGKNQNGGGHARIGLEHAGRHRDHGLQPVAVHQLLADGLVRGGRTEQHAVRHDAGAAPADAQHPQEQGQKQQLGFLGLADFEKIHRHSVCVQTALEGRVGQNQGILLLVRVLVAKAVPVLDKGVVDAVGHHVHGADAEHGAVHVIAEEHVVHVVIFLLAVEEDIFLAVLLQVFTRRNKEAGSAAGRIYKNAVFDTNRKSLLRHISAEKGLKQRAFEVPLCFTAELRKPFFCVFDCCWPVLRPLKLTPQSHLLEE